MFFDRYVFDRYDRFESFLIKLFSAMAIIVFFFWLYIREEYVTVKIKAREVPPEKIDGLTRYLHEIGCFDVVRTGKLIYARKSYSQKTRWQYEEDNVKFYVNGKKIRNGKNFYIHIYLGEEIKVKAIEPHCFEILSYLVGETKARLLTNYVN